MAAAKTFDNQSKLPRLPIPTLENLSQKYLGSCKPILTEEEYAATEDAVEEFVKPGGFGEELQKRLLEYDKTQENSWLEDIWLNKAYLEWREPSMINVNWWGEFVDHPDYKQVAEDKLPPPGILTSFQIHRAAGLINNLLDFKALLDSEKIPPEYMKDIPLCMNQYKKQFGTTRIPGTPADTIQSAHPATAKHIIVLFKDHIFKVDVMHQNGERVTLQNLESALYAVGGQGFASEPAVPVGLLTAGHRDTWAKAYEKLKTLSNQNTENFKVINEALFAVCLDDYCPPLDKDAVHRQFFHALNGHNRWFDKAMQIIVTSSGKADSQQPSISSEPAVSPPGASEERLPEPVKLSWVVDSEVESLIKEAGETAQELINDTHGIIFHTDIYGTRYFKEVAKCSPDAYVQLALQLAYYRVHGELTPMYESAQTRMFKHGRTETGRSVTSETLAFVKSFDDDNVLVWTPLHLICAVSPLKTYGSLPRQYDDKRQLFAAAIKSQSAYMKEATFGRGIDRHMLGLRCMIRSPEESAKATLFTDPAYVKSMYFKLSTSNMSPGKWFWGGFGPVVREGYGVNYAIGKDDLKFSISAKRSYEQTNPEEFRLQLDRTLKDMLILFPKRSQVWGPGWRKQRERELQEEEQLKTMRKLSDDYIKKMRGLAEKHGIVGNTSKPKE
ncbi:hypothetical protein HK104_004461 [Borealophlyctis nickersoniae]|nr:hypothetical protein HK104_004461 [Borealophlyctis nickersoniae]